MLRGVCAVILSALFYTLAFPPYKLSFFAWVSLVPLLLVLPGQTARGRFILGLIYGLAFALGVTSWSVGSVSAYFEIPWLAAAAAVSAMYIVYVGIYVGLFSVGAGRLLRSASPGLKLSAIPALWVLYEYARTYLLAGLPWEFIAHSQYQHLALIQFAELTGELGVSFIVVLVNVAIALVIAPASRGCPSCVRKPGQTAWLATSAGFAIALPLLYGAVRLRQLPPAQGTIELALTQANVHRPRSPNRVDSARAILDYVRTTRAGLDGQMPHLIVWPEYALDDYPENDLGRARALSQTAARARAGLVFGAPRAGKSNGREHLYNAAYFMGRSGSITGFYDKIRLLPFAEYTPAMARPLLPAREQDIFARGQRAGVVDTGPAGRAGQLICYEALFPRLARQAVREGADYLINISNDGWLGLGGSAAPIQHFSMLTFRAIENRVFVARAATTGISGFIDPAGRPFSLLAPDSKGVVFGAVAKPTGRPLALRWGDWFPIVAGIWSAVALGLPGVRPGSIRHG